MLKHLDLFSGIGGFSLACQWAGIETIGFVEIDKYCQKVLRKHWLDVPIVEDIRNVKEIKQIIENAISSNGRSEDRNITDKRWLTSEAGREGIQENAQRQVGIAITDNQPTNIDGRTETKSDFPAILITAGFPCQPFSVAGKRQGKRDDRYLWPETLAVIEAIKPRWVLLENVTGIINLALNTVLSDLEGAGYSTETLIIPACAINAWHRRDRIWIVGTHSNINGESTQPVNGGKRQGFLGIIANSTNAGDRQQLRDKRERQEIDKGQDGFPQSELSESNQLIADTNPARQSDWRGEHQGKQTSGRKREHSIGGCSSRIGQDVSNPFCNSSGTAYSQGSNKRWANDKQDNRNGMGYDTRNRSKALADTQRERLEGEDAKGDSRRTGQPSEYGQGEWQTDWWAVEPELGRVAYGIPSRVDRLKCLGNAIVPQVAYQIIKVIKEVDKTQAT